MAPLKVVPLSETVSVAGQISPADLPGIARAGFRSVICNRPDGESPGQVNHHELALASSQAGLPLAYQPVASGRVSQQDGDAFAELLARLPAPTLAYCRSGMRSATLWALSQADRQPWPTLVQQAAQAGFNLSGMAPPTRSSHS
ncbi:MAG: TIGR01244 family sulfur transferase [Polaromonas sp.]|nr:TIGR01244 family sulfur transferase [Polaromonas sp.]